MPLCEFCGYRYEDHAYHRCYSKREGPVLAGKNKTEKQIHSEIRSETGNKGETEKKKSDKNSVDV